MSDVTEGPEQEAQLSKSDARASDDGLPVAGATAVSSRVDPSGPDSDQFTEGRRPEDGESFREQLRRVEQMAVDNGDIWDLSENDQAALKAVLADRQRMATKLNAAASPDPQGEGHDRSQSMQSRLDRPEGSADSASAVQSVGGAETTRDEGGRDVSVQQLRRAPYATTEDVNDAGTDRGVSEETMATGRRATEAKAREEAVGFQGDRVAPASPEGLDPRLITQCHEALYAAAQFLSPEVPRGPDVDGWANTKEMVDAALRTLTDVDLNAAPSLSPMRLLERGQTRRAESPDASGESAHGTGEGAESEEVEGAPASPEGLDPHPWWNEFHHLWTKAVGAPDYVKAEWVKLEGLLLRAAPPRAEGLPLKDNHHNALTCPYCNPRGLVLTEPQVGAEGLPETGECRECHCTTGGGSYCYKHAPYTVQPKADGSFLVDRNGMKRVWLEPPAESGADGLPQTLVDWIRSNHDRADRTLGHSESFVSCGYPLCQYVNHESRSPDGDGQSSVERVVSGEGQANGTPVSPQAGDQRSKVQSDQQPVGAQGHGGKPQTVNAGGRVTEQYEPQLRRPRPQGAGSNPADSHHTKVGAEGLDRLQALLVKWRHSDNSTDIRRAAELEAALPVQASPSSKE